MAKVALGTSAIGISRLVSPPNALYQSGWFTSLARGYACDCAGSPIPWMSYPAVFFLSQRASMSWDVFEFGAGFSTLWWAQRCHSVTSCEHDAEWCEKLRPQLPSNAQLFDQKLDDDYPNLIRKTKRSYDVVIVDGRKRVKCALSSLECLNDGGVIVWDDTDRDRYRCGLDALKERGFKQLDLVGMGPLSIGLKRTSVLYRSRNVLDL
jgi:hypothetical protein